MSQSSDSSFELPQWYINAIEEADRRHGDDSLAFRATVIRLRQVRLDALHMTIDVGSLLTNQSLVLFPFSSIQQAEHILKGSPDGSDPPRPEDAMNLLLATDARQIIRPELYPLDCATAVYAACFAHLFVEAAYRCFNLEVAEEILTYLEGFWPNTRCLVDIWSQEELHFVAYLQAMAASLRVAVDRLKAPEYREWSDICSSGFDHSENPFRRYAPAEWVRSSRVGIYQNQQSWSEAGLPGWMVQL